MDGCLRCQTCKNTKDIKKLQKQVQKLQIQLNQISQFNGNNINIGSSNNPIDNIFTTNLVNNDFSLKGINLDDTTANLIPSFQTFPKNWLQTNNPISSFRTYHYNNDLKTKEWIKWGLQNNYEIMIGITLNNYEKELNDLSNDYNNSDIELKSKYDINIIAISIGNEESDILQINNGMIYAKNLISSGKLPKNAKITTVLTNRSSDWIIPTYPSDQAKFTEKFLSLYDNMDIICFNLYDGYVNDQLSIDIRLSWGTYLPSVTLNGFGAVRFAIDSALKTITNFTNKPFWCTEIGWQSPGNKLGSTNENLKKFYDNFLLFNMTNNFIPQDAKRSVNPPNRIFYFTIRDTDVNFGLYTNNEILTPKI